MVGDVTDCCMIDRQGIKRRWKADGSKRDERGRRVFAASEARAVGRGGIAATSEITGLARSTIGRGLKELDGPSPPHGRVRREGGGPRLLTERAPTLSAWLSRQRWAIRSGRYYGCQRAWTSWCARLATWAMRSVPKACASCLSGSASRSPMSLHTQVKSQVWDILSIRSVHAMLRAGRLGYLRNQK